MRDTGHSGPDAVLFDMDGTLVDSERLWLEVEHETMAWLGGAWSEEHQKHLVGGSLSVAAAYMLELTGAAVPAHEVERRLLDSMVERLSMNVPLLPGAKELLTAVNEAGIPAALVSSSHRPLIDAALEGLGRDTFALTVAGDEVAHTKPHPEPYLTAAASLGVEPGRCVVLEDSPTGVASAEAAGCPVIAIPHVLPVEPAPGRTVVHSLTEVDLDLLRSVSGV